MIDELKKCARSIPSDQPKGHLFLLEDDDEFLQTTKMVRTIPPKPPKDPVVDTSATQYQIAQANKNHARAEKAYKTYLLVKDALKKLITENIEEFYLSDVDEAATVLEIIKFLKLRYYKITPIQIANNNRKLRKKWEPNEEPIEAYFD